MENIIQIMDTPIRIKEWAGQRVITFQDIDTVHQRARGTASRNFRENRDKFIEGTDFFLLTQPDEIRCVGVTRPQGGTFDKVTLITESGYLMIVKSLHDDLAWAVQRLLVNTYFKAKEQAAAPVEETTVALVNHETVLRAAAIMASCPNSTQYVLNCLRHVIPDIDQTPTVTVQAGDKPIEIPKLPEPEAAVVTSTFSCSARRPFNYMKLQALMEKKKLKNVDVAAMLGIDSSTVSNWKLGHCPPTNPNRKRLCSIFRVPDDYFDK